MENQQSKEQLMTLVASDDTPLVSGMNGDVQYDMLDGTKRVPVIVSGEALRDAAGIGLDEAKGREIGLLEQFGDAIGTAANRKYDLGQVEADGTVVVRTPSGPSESQSVGVTD